MRHEYAAAPNPLLKSHVSCLMSPMKGVLICGGTGSRLRPLTAITNKSLLPVYDRPLIDYPLDVLRAGGITDIVVITGPEHMDQMAAYLGSGSQFGCSFAYRVQEKPGGIAQALALAEEFVDGDNLCAILGDNVYMDDLSESMKSFTQGAHVFLKEVPDPERFGVAKVAMSGERLAASDNEKTTRYAPAATRSVTVLDIEEKPATPKSNLAVTGCYLYDPRCFEFIRTQQPSARGELEITDVSRRYLELGELQASVLQNEWIDAGTFESLYRATSVVRERRFASFSS